MKKAEYRKICDDMDTTHSAYQRSFKIKIEISLAPEPED